MSKSAAVLEVVDDTNPNPSAIDVLKTLEAQATPLRDRIRDIDTEVANVIGNLGPEPSIEEEVASKKRLFDLDVERGVVASRLGGLEPKIVVAREEARAEELLAARASFAASGSAELAKVAAKADELLAAAEAFKEFYTENGRKRGIRVGAALHASINDVLGTIGKARNIMGGTQR